MCSHACQGRLLRSPVHIQILCPWATAHRLSKPSCVAELHTALRTWAGPDMLWLCRCSRRLQARLRLSVRLQ